MVALEIAWICTSERGDGRESRNGKGRNRNRTHDYQQHGDHNGHNGPINEEPRHKIYLPFICPSLAAPNGSGFTVIPGPTFWTPSATILSPGLSPWSMIHIVPVRSPTLTVRMSILFSPSMTAT